MVLESHRCSKKYSIKTIGRKILLNAAELNEEMECAVNL